MKPFSIAVGVALLVLVTNVAISFAWVAFYSLVINPGHPESFYSAYAQRAAPFSSIVAGMPLMWIAGRWIAKRFGPATAMRNALIVWGTYAAIDVVALASTQVTTRMVSFTIVSLVTKLAAVVAGARMYMTRKAPALPNSAALPS